MHNDNFLEGIVWFFTEQCCFPIFILNNFGLVKKLSTWHKFFRSESKVPLTRSMEIIKAQANHEESNKDTFNRRMGGMNEWTKEQKNDWMNEWNTSLALTLGLQPAVQASWASSHVCVCSSFLIQASGCHCPLESTAWSSSHSIRKPLDSSFSSTETPKFISLTKTLILRSRSLDFWSYHEINKTFFHRIPYLGFTKTLCLRSSSTHC